MVKMNEGCACKVKRRDCSGKDQPESCHQGFFHLLLSQVLMIQPPHDLSVRTGHMMVISLAGDYCY